MQAFRARLVLGTGCAAMLVLAYAGKKCEVLSENIVNRRRCFGGWVSKAVWPSDQQVASPSPSQGPPTLMSTQYWMEHRSLHSFLPHPLWKNPVVKLISYHAFLYILRPIWSCEHLDPIYDEEISPVHHSNLTFINESRQHNINTPN